MTEQRRPGRPIQGEEARSEAIPRVRVMPSELARYQAHADACDLSWSDWVREAFEEKCKRKPRRRRAKP